jgi:hypothetical protein
MLRFVFYNMQCMLLGLNYYKENNYKKHDLLKAKGTDLVLSSHSSDRMH